MLRRHLGRRRRVYGAGGLREACEVLAHLSIEGRTVALARLRAPARRRHRRGAVRPRPPLLAGHQASAAHEPGPGRRGAPGVNRAQADRYAVPAASHPIGQRIAPIVDDLLAEWSAEQPRAQVGVTVLGHRFAAASYTVKDYLSRSLVPFVWMDLGEDPAARVLARELNLPDPAPTTVLLDDGRCLCDPSIAELAAALGLTREATRRSYDLIVVGGGPAGLAAAVYGACEGLGVVVIEDDRPGGQAGEACGSRTTRASRRGSAAPTSPTGRWLRRAGWGWSGARRRWRRDWCRARARARTW